MQKKEGDVSGKKAQLTWDTLIPWIIAISVMVFVVILYVMLSGKGEGAIQYLVNLFKFGSS